MNNKQRIKNCILDNPGITYGELYWLIRLHSQTVKKYLSQLEKDGLIRRERDETSRRKVRLYSASVPEKAKSEVSGKTSSCPCCGASEGEMESQRRVREAIKANPGATYDELSGLLGQTIRTIKKYAARLRRIGLVRCEYDEAKRRKARLYSSQAERVG